ncbi:amino acid transporter [Mobiluncus sp.]|uniref:amino acid transporter n=1 Tax=Mobiluncus sp. TaxID=47293 RepID=UPI002A91E5D2|nr:amino acid transporter [Mobiluncus sp.]MDY6076712.1 amino acid transporter [Mobiluncus sp.]
MLKNLTPKEGWLETFTQLAFFAPKFWFPALIAASVFPSLIAYSGPIFSAVALWIVAFVLIAGLITTLAHGYSLGQTHRLDSTAALVQAYLGSFLGALTAAASLLAMVVAVAALVSTATTFIVVSADLPENYRVWILIAGFVLLLLALFFPEPIRRAIPWLTLVIFVVGFLLLAYGFWHYLHDGAKPGLLELLSSTTKAKNAVADANLQSGWKAAAVAALLLVPVIPAVTLFRNESRQPLSGLMFRVLGGSAAAMFAATVYLSFTVAGFHWTRLDTVIQGPGNLALLLRVLLDENGWLVVPIMSLFALGCLISAYIYVSSVSTLLTDLSGHDLAVHQVPVSWMRRGRSASILTFMIVTFAVALTVHSRMGVAALTWVTFVAISSFLGQVARMRMWRSRFHRGATYVQRRQSKRYYRIAIISVIISLIILIVVSVAFNSIFELYVLAVWAGLGLLIYCLNLYYRRVQNKMSQLEHAETPVKHTLALVMVPRFDASALKTIRYAWAAHHPNVEVVHVLEPDEDETEVRRQWQELGITATLTLIPDGGGNHLGSVQKYLNAKLDMDPLTSISVYLARYVPKCRALGWLHNAAERTYARHLARLERVTITWVSLTA